MLSAISACGIFDQNPPQNTDPVDKGSILAIDEANQNMYNIDLGNMQPSFYSYVGPAANQVIVDGDYAYLAVSLSHTIIKMDLKHGGAPDTYRFWGSPNPYMMAIDSNRLYVTLLNDNKLAVFNKDTLSLITNLALPAGDYPQGVISDHGHIYITTSVGYLSWGDTGNYTNGQVLVLDKNDFSLVTNIRVHHNPHTLCLYNDMVYVAATSQYNNTGKVQAIDLADYSVQDMPQVGAEAPGFIYEDGSRLYVIDNPSYETYYGSGIYEGGLGGILIYDTLISNSVQILSNIALKGLVFDNDYVYASSAYGGNNLYRIEKSNCSNISIFSNIGGGAIAIYQ